MIDSAVVIQEMIAIRKELEKQHKRAEELGVSEEELGFYDALAVDTQAAYDDEFLRALVHEIVQTMTCTIASPTSAKRLLVVLTTHLRDT